MDPYDEELIKKFADLQPGGSSQALIIPQAAAVTTNWELCVIAQVRSDRMIFDSQFEKMMRRVWDLNPNTTLRQKDRGTFLVECCSKEEKTRILNEGPWVYRDDLVAVSPGKSNADLTEQIQSAEIWVQFHGVQADSLTDEGLALVTGRVGKPITDPIRCSINGRQFLRIKLQVDISNALKDRVNYTHPTLGESNAFLTYEKLGRICHFCGLLGHELCGCPDRIRLARIKNQIRDASRPEFTNILNPTFGLWRINSSLIPQEVNEEAQPNPQRSVPKSSRQHDSEGNSGQKRSLQDYFGPAQT